MAINLDDHKIFDWQLKIETVPLSVAKRAVAEATTHTEPKLDEAMDLIKQALTEMNNTVNNALKDD
jgi:hypothetical protein